MFRPQWLGYLALLGTSLLPTSVWAEAQNATLTASGEQAAEAVPQPRAAPPPAKLVVPAMDQRPGVDTTALPPWWRQHTPVVGLALAAVGVLAGGFGSYYVAVDGNTLEKDKINGNGILVRNTGTWGWSLLGLGAASVVIGSAMVIWGREDGSEISLAVGPASMGLQGRF
jgi:hypothetical protein